MYAGFEQVSASVFGGVSFGTMLGYNTWNANKTVLCSMQDLLANEQLSQNNRKVESYM
jgi:hypothetical protein